MQTSKTKTKQKITHQKWYIKIKQKIYQKKKTKTKTKIQNQIKL